MKTISIVIMSIIGLSLTGGQNEPLENQAGQSRDSLVTGVYTVFITKDVEASKTFYEKWFRFNVVFESSWFVLLSTPGEHPSLIAFMHENHPSNPPSPKAFNGSGGFITIDVEDAKILYENLKAEKANFTYILKDEPWGQRRFALTDPNGIWVDVVQQIQPQEGWWDQYMK